MLISQSKQVSKRVIIDAKIRHLKGVCFCLWRTLYPGSSLGLTLMITAPRCWMVVMNSPLSHSSSFTTSRIGFPPTVPWLTSGYCVDEWFPQMMAFFTSVTGCPVFSEICKEQEMLQCGTVACKGHLLLDKPFMEAFEGTCGFSISAAAT